MSQLLADLSKCHMRRVLICRWSGPDATQTQLRWYLEDYICLIAQSPVVQFEKKTPLKYTFHPAMFDTVSIDFLKFMQCTSDMSSKV